MFENFENEMSDFNLVQLVRFTTWSRMVGPDLRSSILDHIYVMDPTVISNLTSTRPYFGDHLMVELTVNGPKRYKEVTLQHDWRRYSVGL